MAATILTGNTLSQKLWDMLMHWQALFPTFWNQNGLMGTDEEEDQFGLNGPAPHFPIVRKEQFGPRKKGDKLTMVLQKALTNIGTGEGVDPTSYEETPDWDDFACYVQIWRHQAKITEPDASNQRVTFDMEKRTMDGLSAWAQVKYDNENFHAYYYGYSKNLIIDNAAVYNPAGPIAYASRVKHPFWYYGNAAAPKGWDATAEGNMDSTQHKMSVAQINRQVAILRKRKVAPIMWKGSASYLGIISEEQAADLWDDPRMEKQLIEAKNRGDDNPIWNGVDTIGKVNDCFICVSGRIQSAAYDGEGVATGDGVADGENVHRAIFTGAHAIALGMASPTKYTQLAENKYGSLWGRGVFMHYGATRIDWTDIGNQSSQILSTPVTNIAT